MSQQGKVPASEEELINLLNRSKEIVAGSNKWGFNVWEYMKNVYSNFVPAFGVYIGRMFKEFPSCLKSDDAKEPIAYFIKNILEGGYVLLPVVLPVNATYGGFIVTAATFKSRIEGTPTILVELFLDYFAIYSPYMMVGIFAHELLHHAAPPGKILLHSGMLDILTESDCVYLQALVTGEERMRWVNKEERNRLDEVFGEAYGRFRDKILAIESEVDNLFFRVTGLTKDEFLQMSTSAIKTLEYVKELQMELPPKWSPSMLSTLLYWANKNGVGNIMVDIVDYLGLTREDLASLKQFANEVLQSIS